MAKIDWDYWRNKFVTGADSVTLKKLSEVPGAPAYQTLKNRANKESWGELRKRYEYQKSTMAAAQPGVAETVATAQKIIDSVEMLTRHSHAARFIGGLGIKALKAKDPEKISGRDAIALIKLGVEIERLTEGLATQRQELDVTGLSDAELEKLASGG